MKGSGQAILGVLAAVLSAFIVFGSLALSMAEGNMSIAFLPSLTPTSTQPIPTPRPGEPTFTPSPSPAATATATQITPSGICQPPQGWTQAEVALGDDWPGLAQRYATTPEELIQANCTEFLLAGSIIWVPPVPPTATGTNTAVPTAIPYSSPVPARPLYCPRPSGWVDYYVRRGDTLYRIGLAVGVNYKVLMARNCLASTVIYVGQRLYVPYLPVPTVYIPPTPISTSTAAPIPTNTSVPPTPTRVPPTATKVIPPTTQPPPATTEPPPATTEPPPATTEPPPATTEPPPATTVPPPVTTEPPPVTTEPPPATTVPPPPTTEPPPATTEPPVITIQPPPLPTEPPGE